MYITYMNEIGLVTVKLDTDYNSIQFFGGYAYFTGNGIDYEIETINIAAIYTD